MLIPAALAVLSGLLYVFSFAPWDLGWLQWVAFVPLLIGVQKVQDQTPSGWNRSAIKKYALLGFLMSLVICIGGFYWIIYSVQQYGGLPYWAALIVFGLFCGIGQLQIPIYLLLREWAKNSKRLDQSFWAWPLLAGAFYAGVESLYPKLFSDTAGNAFYKNSWIRQAADLGGPFVLTWISISVNEWLARAWLFKELRSLVSAILMIALVSGYGAYRVNEWKTKEAAAAAQPKLAVSILQANIGDFLKLEAERGSSSALEQVLGAYLQLGTQALSSDVKPDLMVWPETAYPTLFEKPQNEAERSFERLAKDFARRAGGTFAFGGYDQDLTRQEYNSFFFYQPQDDSHQVYHKHHLLMFGETLPFAEIFPSMRSWFPTMGFFGRGEGAITVSVKNSAGHEFKLAPSICYEGLFHDFAIEGAKLGADALINVTNDSWFGPEGEPYLHLALTTYRSIETRLPMLRSTNTGFSVLIDPTGEIRKSTSLYHSEILNAEITPRAAGISPYAFLAQYLGTKWFDRLCQILLILFILRHFSLYTKSSRLT